MQDSINGLTTEQVNERVAKGLVNYNNEPKTKTIEQIIKTNVFTYFNFLNVILGGLVLLSGLLSNRFFYGLKNCLFVGVIFTNTVISIAEEIFAKKTIDKLNVIAESKVKVIRNSKISEINRESIVLDDLCILENGNQVVTDVEVISGKVEVNESFITGESKAITKKQGDTILSGSFIVSGSCQAKVIHVGKDNYVSKITSEAKYVKKTNSVIYNSFDKMVKILSICLIPVGILFFINQLVISNYHITDSIMSTVSALIGMIPEGLVLLTSSAMAVSVIRLRKYHVLVQELYSIENLARVDVICLDKTGTITDGNMEVAKIEISKNVKEDDFNYLLSNYIGSINDNSITMAAIKKHLEPRHTLKVIDSLDFSSIRKYSAIKFEDACYYLGSPDNLLKSIDEDVKKEQVNYRTLVFAKGNEELENLDNLEVLGYIFIQDRIKQNAKQTLDYFKSQGVEVKIISGDNDQTVANIAKKVGITDVRNIDLSKVDDSQIPQIVEKYNIFGRVKPEQKKKIIASLQQKGHVVGMTGDGVNDCLALKTADCSIAMSSGSDAAKNVSQFVLLDNKIDNLPLILQEGRRSVNNIERSSTLLLSKTIFTVILILVCIFLSTEYFFIPIQLTLITAFTISVPSFLLALENNHELIKGNFLQKIFLKSFPSAITVVFNVVIIKLFERQFGLDAELCSTLTVFLTATTGFIFLNSICKPYNVVRAIMFSVLILGFLFCALFQSSFFNISLVNNDTILVFVVLFICSLFIFDKLKMLSKYLLKKTNNL